MSRYSPSDLWQIYQRTAGTKHDIEIIADLGLCTPAEVKLLISVFSGEYCNEQDIEDTPLPKPPYTADQWEW